VKAFYIIEDANKFAKAKSIANGIGILSFFVGIYLSIKYNNGLLFVFFFFVAWFIAYFIVGYMVIHKTK
jgi:hypothetical protein